jgi:gamma-glutamylputrescine oxidase
VAGRGSIATHGACSAATNDNYYEATAGGGATFPALHGEVVADACVVGGGYTGLSAALHLAERGYSVVVLEARRVGSGASGRNGGQLGSGQRLGVLELEAALGRERTRALWELAEEARRLVAERIRRHGIDCHYRAGNMLAVTRQRYLADVEAEVRHLETHYGYREQELLDLGEMRRRVASAQYVAGCLDRGGGHLHPLRFALGLARAAADAGVRIFEHSAARRVQWGSPSRVLADGSSVRARHVLLCGNAYLPAELAPRLADRIMPIVNHLLATEPLGEARARDTILDGCCVHASKYVVDYFRFSHDHRLIFGGGETYGIRAPRELKAFVRRHMLRVFPQLADVRIDHAWSGRVAISMSRLPDFGRVGVNGWYVQGYSGHGVALSQIAGRLLAEAVAGTAERFDVFAGLPHRRFPGGRWLRQPLLVAGMLWYALRDRL